MARYWLPILWIILAPLSWGYAQGGPVLPSLNPEPASEAPAVPRGEQVPPESIAAPKGETVAPALPSGPVLPGMIVGPEGHLPSSLPQGFVVGCPAPCISHRLHLVEEQTETTKPGLKIVEDTIGLRPYLEVLYREEERVVEQTVVKERKVPQEVPWVHYETCKTVDPCTGQCHTEMKELHSTRMVYVTVYEPVCEKVKIKVKVPYLKATQAEALVKLRAVPVAEPAVMIRYRTVPGPEMEAPPCPVAPHIEGTLLPPAPHIEGTLLPPLH
jgi:hypothetical protein